jgi:carbon storage regulator
MKIFTIPFEEKFYITLGDKVVKLVTFPTTEPGNIKFGIDASRDIQVHREEIYESIQNQKQNSDLPKNKN